MSENENAAKQPKPRNAVRTAWRWLASYVAVEVFFYVSFEWSNAGYGDVELWAFFRGVAFLFFAGVSLFLFIRSFLRRKKAATLLYAALFGVNLYLPSISTSLDNTAKAYFFSAFPEMCPEGSPKPGYRVALCYDSWLMHWRTALILNPGDELAKPYTTWPREFDKELFRNADAVFDECEKKYVKLLVNHVYLLEDRPQC